VQLIFDTGFERPLTLTHSDQFNERIVRGPQPETVRDYRVEVETDDGWMPVARVSGNYQRRRVHDFESCVTSAVRVVVEATNGDEQARVFELRAYQ